MFLAKLASYLAMVKWAPILNCVKNDRPRAKHVRREGQNGKSTRGRGAAPAAEEELATLRTCLCLHAGRWDLICSEVCE